LLPLLISIENFLDVSDVGVGAFSFTSCSVEPTSLYDLMETIKEMASSKVKEQLNHSRFKKVTKKRPKIH
jgi:hypothetical protein